MQIAPHIHQEHDELFALAASVRLEEPVTPALAQRARQRLQLLGERLAEHLRNEAESIHSICSIADGARSVACRIRQREAEGLSESMDGLLRRWGTPGDIEREPRAFISTWEIFLAAMQRLQSREDAEIYPGSDEPNARAITAPRPTGLPAIDRDHDRMFALIGGLRAAVGGGQRDIDGRMAAELASYVEGHMADEEAIMEATGFPGLEDHRREHHLARTILLGFRNDYLDGRHVTAAAVLQFLERWLDSHIAEVDQVMARHALQVGWQP